MSISKARIAIIAGAVGILICGIRWASEFFTDPAVIYSNHPDCIDGTQRESTDLSGDPVESVSVSDSTGDALTPVFPVYICGAISRSGIYYITNQAYLYEIIDRAGGLDENAASEYINMVLLIDESVSIYIPFVDEILNNTGQSPEDSSIHVRIVRDQYMSGSTTNPDIPADGISDQVNINTAGISELITLSGIGQVTAQAIIFYRENNGLFASIEDIMKVPGIKEGRFEAIKDHICI